MDRLEQIASYFKLEVLPPNTPEMVQLDYLVSWAQSAESVISNFPEPENIDGREVYAAVDIIGDEIRARGDAVLAALQGNLKSLPRALAPPFASAHVRALLIGAFIAASAGIALHSPREKAKLYALGKWTPADAQSDYRYRLGVFQGIVKLASSGVLEILVPPPPEPPPVMGKGLVSGASAMTAAWLKKQEALGEPITLSVGTIVVVVVAAIAILALCVVAYRAITAWNKMMDVCLNRGDLQEWQQDICRDVANGPKDMWASVVRYGALVVGIGAAVYFLPTIVERVQKARHVARES